MPLQPWGNHRHSQHIAISPINGPHFALAPLIISAVRNRIRHKDYVRICQNGRFAMENMWNEAKNNTNLRTMFVKEILVDNTDENHFITIGEILNILNSSYGIHAVRQTIYEDIDMLIDAGYDIESVSGRNNTHMYHLVAREFEMAELRLVIDAIESIRSLPLAKVNSLKNKLCRLAGPSANYLLQNTSLNELSRTENPQFYYIIDTLSDAIASKRQISFKYCEHLSSSKKPLKREGIDYQVSPYRLVCYINYYYLIAYSEKHMQIMAFRIDCICDVPEIIRRNIIPEPKGLRLDRCIKDSSDIQSGKFIELSLEFDNSVADAMVSRFGDALKIITINGSTCRARATVQISNAFFAWIFSFDGKVSINGPLNVRDEYIRMVSREMARL